MGEAGGPYSGAKDWHLESGLIAHYMPGLGNPMDLPIDDFNAYARRVGVISKLAGGGLSDRDVVEIEEGIGL